MTTLLVIWALAGWCAAALASHHRGRRAELVARAAHELRGPLTAVHLVLDLLGRRGEITAEGAAAVEAQLHRVRLALEDLALAPRGGRAPEQLEPVALTALVAQVALAWRPAVAAAGRELRVAAAPPDSFVLADRTRLAQAAGNLISNALEHGGGPIDLRARVVAGRVRREVADHGDGLPAPVAEITRRPRRGRGARGRGMAIAADIVTRHGGRLTSAPSAAGAALAIELPVLPA